MKNLGWLFSLLAVLPMTPCSPAREAHRAMTGSAAGRPQAANLEVLPDLDQRLGKFRQVRMPFHSSGLTARERELVEKLVDASRYLEEIYWRQSDPEALSQYQSLSGNTHS